jgi:hypothetical protein
MGSFAAQQFFSITVIPSTAWRYPAPARLMAWLACSVAPAGQGPDEMMNAAFEPRAPVRLA